MPAYGDLDPRLPANRCRRHYEALLAALDPLDQPIPRNIWDQSVAVILKISADRSIHEHTKMMQRFGMVEARRNDGPHNQPGTVQVLPDGLRFFDA